MRISPQFRRISSVLAISHYFGPTGISALTVPTLFPVLVATALDKNDQIIRRNLGMNENQGGSGTLNVHVLAGGGRSVISVPQPAGIANAG
jgi:hypothetical protein